MLMLMLHDVSIFMRPRGGRARVPGGPVPHTAVLSGVPSPLRTRSPVALKSEYLRPTSPSCRSIEHCTHSGKTAAQHKSSISSSAQKLGARKGARGQRSVWRVARGREASRIACGTDSSEFKMYDEFHTRHLEEAREEAHTAACVAQILGSRRRGNGRREQRRQQRMRQ